MECFKQKITSKKAIKLLMKANKSLDDLLRENFMIQQIDIRAARGILDSEIKLILSDENLDVK